MIDKIDNCDALDWMDKYEACFTRHIDGICTLTWIDDDTDFKVDGVSLYDCLQRAMGLKR